VFVSDWCDTGECHNYDKVDLTNGRIHKIVYGKVKPWKGDLSKLSDGELIELQKHKNDWFPRHARRILQERKSKGTLAPGTIDRLNRATAAASTTHDKLRLTWVSHSLGEMPNWSVLDEDKTDVVEAWKWRITMEIAADEYEAGYSVKVPDAVRPISSPAARLAIASGIRRIDPLHRFKFLVVLLNSLRPEDATDANLPLMVWYAIEPAVDSDRRTELFLMKAKIPLVRQLIAHKVAATNDRFDFNLVSLLKLLWEVNEDDLRRDVLQGTIDGLGGIRERPAPFGWGEVGRKLLASSDRLVRERAMSLAVTFNDESAIATMKKTAADVKGHSADRFAALHTLQRRGKPDLLPILQQLVNDKDLRAEAIRGLAAFNDPGTPAMLLKLYPNLTDAEKEMQLKKAWCRGAMFPSSPPGRCRARRTSASSKSWPRSGDRFKTHRPNERRSPRSIRPFSPKTRSRKPTCRRAGRCSSRIAQRVTNCTTTAAILGRHSPARNARTSITSWKTSSTRVPWCRTNTR
jgi:hypothetical protein